MIVTPLKLMIDLPRDYSFALMARLFPKVDAFTFLKRVEGIQKIHHLAGFAIGMICFWLQFSTLSIVLWTFFVVFGFYLIRFFGFFFLPGLVQLSTYYSYLTSFGIFTIILIAFGFWRVGLLGVVAFFGMRLAVEFLTWYMDRRAGRKIGIKVGLNHALANDQSMFLAPIQDFVNTYQLFALRDGITLDVNVTDEEIIPENWMPVWDDFVMKWPEIAARYPNE